MPDHKYPNWPFVFGPGLQWMEEQERKKKEKQKKYPINCGCCGKRIGDDFVDNWADSWSVCDDCIEEAKKDAKKKDYCEICGSKFEVVEIDGIKICKRCAKGLLDKLE